MKIKIIVWKIVYKTIQKWEIMAYRNGLMEQVEECIQIQNRLMHYKSVMIEKGIWR